MSGVPGTGNEAVSSADNPFYFGTIRSEVRLRGGSMHIEDVLIPLEAVNGQRADHILGGVVAFVRVAIDEINQYVNLHRCPARPTTITVEKVYEREDKVLRVRLEFMLNVDVPKEMIEKLGHAVIAGVDNCLSHRLQPGMSPFLEYESILSAPLRQLFASLAVISLSTPAPWDIPRTARGNDDEADPSRSEQ